MRFSYVSTLFLTGIALLSADNLQKARFTEVIRDVRVSKANATEMREAKVNDNFEVPEVIRTGMDSRAELEAPDKTIARIGSNTVFSFEAAKRTMNLQSGSVLFHSPKGMGGGIIKTAAATAAVTGTTILVGATSNGGFKLMVLEGSSKVTLPNGVTQRLNEGQLTFILPGTQNNLPVIDFRLSAQTKGSSLVGGFNKPLASLEKVEQAEAKQERGILKGRLVNTALRVGEANKEGVNVTDDARNFPTVSEIGSGSGGNFTLGDYLRSRFQKAPSALLGGNNAIRFPDLYFSKRGQSVNFGSGLSFANSFAVFGAKEITFSSGAAFQLPSNFLNLGSINTFAFVADDNIAFLGAAKFEGSSDQTVRFCTLNGNMNFKNGTLDFTQKTASFESAKVMDIAGTTFNGQNFVFSGQTIDVSSTTQFNGNKITFYVPGNDTLPGKGYAVVPGAGTSTSGLLNLAGSTLASINYGIFTVPTVGGTTYYDFGQINGNPNATVIKR